jgi:single-strand DNA-binding protein
MITVGLARIGNDPAVRYTQDGKAVLELSLAYNYGRKGQDGNYATQWVNASLWGERCEKIVNYLHKGGQVVVQLSDLHLNEYTKQDGTKGVNLRALIRDLQLVGKPQAKEPAPHEQFEKPASQPAKDADLIDDIPF